MSGGRLLMDFKFKVVDSVIREVSKGVKNYYTKQMIVLPKFEMNRPHPGGIHYRNFNKFDGFMFFYDRMLPTAYRGSRGRLMFLPYLLYSRQKRFRTWLLTGADFRVFIHEIFHNIEQCYRIRPAHRYEKRFRHKWPSWYKRLVARRGSVSELDYYTGCFKKYILPKGLKKLMLRRYRRSKLEPSLYKKIEAIFDKFPLKVIRRSKELYDRARKLRYKRKQYLRAVTLNKKALALFKYNHRALVELGALYQHYLRKRKKAAYYYKKYLKQFAGWPGTEQALLGLLWHLHWYEKDYLAIKRLIKRYGKYADSVSAKPKLLYYRAIAAGEQGDRKLAVKLLYIAISHKSTWLRRHMQRSLKKYKRELVQPK